MGKLFFLGTGFAVPEEGHENTHFFIEQGERGILVDCATNPLPQLRKAGIGMDQITDLFITHFHPDHASGLVMLLMSMWLLGRKKQLDIYGLAHTIERAKKLMELFDWKTWPDFYPTYFHVIADDPRTLAFETPEIRITTSPVNHLIPTMGLRVELMPQGKVIVYSSDTEPCANEVDLAHGADVLIHEAAGPAKGHSSPAQAGTCARLAGVNHLILVHTTPREGLYAGMVAQASREFGGEVSLATDGLILDL